MKESWDNVGLNCGRMDRQVTRILVALDPFEPACLEAREFGAELLVTHHALIWKPGFITDQNSQGKNTLFLIENGIAHINAHTNLDLAPGGINDVLAQTLGLQEIQVIRPEGTDAEGRPYGLLRCGIIAQQTLETFLASVKENLHCDGLRYVAGSSTVRKVAVGGGSCADEMFDALNAGCDTFVTSDVKYNQFRTAYENGLNLIDAGHFHTENPTMPILAAKLQAAFPEIQVKFSETHHDCMKFY